MFGSEYILALIKAFVRVAFQVAFAIVSAIPFRIAWNAVIPIYAKDWIPEIFHNLPYWHFVGIILVFTFLGEQIGKISPFRISITEGTKK